MRKSKSRKVWYLFAMMLVLSMSLMFSAVYASAATSTSKKAKNAYKKLLTQKRIEVLKKGSWYWSSEGKEVKNIYLPVAKNVTFHLIYLDNNNVPELVVRDTQHDAFALYRFKNNKAVKLVQGSSKSKGGSIPYYYYKKTGLLYVQDSKVSKVYVYYYNGKTMTAKYVWYQDGEKYYKNPVKKSHNTLTDGTTISKTQYVKEIGNYQRGHTTTKTFIHVVSNTAANRKKLLG